LDNKNCTNKIYFKGEIIMVSKQLTLVNAQGFHMRPASVFATAMGKYSSDVTIKFDGKDVNAKSLLNIIAACIKCGSEIEVVCSGEDENEALAEAVKLIESGLGE
jgi:phosphocarrier protein